MSEPKLRRAVRGLMIDTSDRVLLAGIQVGAWSGWVLPGGGVEPGESDEVAIRRELSEETGVPQVFLGPRIATRTFPGSFDGYDGQTDHIFLVPCHDFEPAPTMSEEELRAEGLVELRWWTLAEIRESTEEIRPRHLVELTERILEFGAPPEPIVLVDPD